MRKFFTCFLLLLLFQIAVNAQTGTIKGIVTDFKTSETLIGTTVLIQGTTQGTITNFDGEFIIQKVNPGKYNLVISFISYQTKIVQIEVENEIETVVNVSLEPATLDIGEVKVVAKRRTDTDMSMISSLKAQNLIVKSQDKDAAEVIRRVPGITITDGRFVVVRGLVERYNSVMLNNSTAPSFEADKRAFSFDAIPSGLIDNILIYKSPAPELPADFAGAAINIQTKNAADQNSFSFSYGTKYVQNTSFNNDFLTHENSKTDWLGYDNGSRAIPDGVPGQQEFAELYVWPNAELYVQRTDEINNISALFANNWETSNDAPFLDQNFSVSLQRRFVVGKASFGNITSLNYGTSNSYTSGTRTEFLEFDEDQYRTVMDFDFVDKVSKKEFKTGLIHNWNMIYGKNQKLEFRNFLNQTGIQSTTQRNGIRYDNGETLELLDLKYESRLVYSGQLSGEQLFNGDCSKINWMMGYSHTNKNQPDNRRLTSVQINDETSERDQQYYLRLQNVPNPYYAGRLWIDMNENTYDAKLDFTHNFKLFSSENIWSFKTGGFYENKQRQFNSRLIGVVAMRNPPDIFFNPISEIMAPENFYFDRTSPYTHHGLSYRDNTRAKDNYNDTDKMKSGYLALNIPVTKKLNVYGGVRVENWSREIRDFWEITETADKTPITRDTVDFFVSVNATYNINEKNLLRASYGETVNRPEFREMAPFDYQDFELFAIVYGNPDLKAAYIKNYDLRYEWYPNQGEMISGAGFYKAFTDPIETFLRPSGSTYDYFFYNTEEAYSAGVEIDVRKRFTGFENSAGFFRFMKDLTVIFNTSLIKSEINTSQQEFTRDTVRVMSGQSPYIVNLGLFYNNVEKGWDINLNYNIIGKRIAYVGTPANPHTWELPRNSLDLTVQKTFKHNLQLKAGIKDILNDPVRFVQYYGDSEELVKDTRNYIPNRQFSLSLTWTF
ncbi:MAG: TonB-dependent receptor [Draconibacterium sp.]|nr:TonB-dependent receptor [Draconibacterium sp.]